jgi:polysaccharide biosynthesis/export protein
MRPGAGRGRWTVINMFRAILGLRGPRILPAVAQLLVAGLLIVMGVGLVHAQSSPGGSGQKAAPAETTQEFNQRLSRASKDLAAKTSGSLADESRIGPDDLLEISIFEAPEMNCNLRVSAGGEISMQLLGSVKAGGLTPRELELVLQELLRRTYMKDPHVGVYVEELQSHPVSVVGAVKKPDVFQIRGTKTVIEMLSMAEGLADDAGDSVWVMRGASLAGAESPQSQGSKQATSAAPSQASGDSKSGDSPVASVQEGKGEIVKINLKDLLDSADPTLNVSVHPGDIIKVSRAGIVYVVGEVQKPGGFVLTNNESISALQAIALAQGLTRTSLKSHARIIRTDPGTGKRTEFPLDIGKILADKAPDPTLQPKDIVFVPNSAAKSAFYRGTETVLYSAAEASIYRW